MDYDNLANFPSHDIDPREKNAAWILQFARAAWGNGGGNMPVGTFYNGKQLYNEIQQYAIAKQSINKYKKISQPDKAIDNSSLNRDMTVVPLIPLYRNKSLSKLLQRQHTVNAFAIDELSQNEQDKIINKLRVKIAMREAILEASQQHGQGQQLPDFLKADAGEPEDMQQLNVMLQFGGFKHPKIISTELMVDWLFNDNDFDKERKKMVPNQYDLGAGGYKVWIDENGKPKFRSIHLDKFVVSFCTEPDFSDASFMGEGIYVNVVDLVPFFNDNEIKEICEKVRGLYDNPKYLEYSNRRYYDKFKVLVFDLQFMSYNTTVYKSNLDKHGNEHFGKTDFSNIKKVNDPENFREGEAKYLKNRKKVRYDCMWIVGTDFMYDYGIAKNQPRKLSSWWETKYDYVIEAWNFNKMQFVGITEGMIPLADDYYETHQKLQNIKRKLIPYMINVDIRALENVKFGKGGSVMTPNELVDLMFKSHILIYSGADLIEGTNTPIKPVSIEATGMIQELVQLRNELLQIKSDTAEVSGYNQATLGNADPKMLVPGYDMAAASTNDSLWQISETDRRLTLRLADLLVQKAQISTKLGKIRAYSNALGMGVAKVFEIDPDISNREFGIFLEEAPTQQERQEFYQNLAEQDQKGLLEPQDRLLIESCRNMKLAQLMLSYIVNKRKEQQQQYDLQKIDQNNQGAAQAAQLAEQAKQATMKLQSQLKIQELNVSGQWTYITEEMKKGKDSDNVKITAQAKILAQQIMSNSRKNPSDAADSMDNS